MSQIILDFGSGNTCKNEPAIIMRMIDELAKVDTRKHEVVIKWQLFIKAGDNIPLTRQSFDYAYDYAAKVGYKTTSSVFDLQSMRFLLYYDIPFVKIANNRNLDWLIGEVPRKIPVYVSISRNYKIGDSRMLYDNEDGYKKLACVSKYPAKPEEYKETFLHDQLCNGISDHTIGLDLFNKYKPEIWEKHYKLSDSTGLDAGPFAITPEELKEIL